MVGGFSDRWSMVSLVGGRLFLGKWSVVGVTVVGGLWSVAGRWAVVLYYADLHDPPQNHQHHKMGYTD